MNQSVEAEALYSAQWWQSRTNEQLHELMRGGLGEGEIGTGAHRELERRAQELTRTAERNQQLAAQHKKSLRLRILEGMLLAVLIILLAIELLR